MGQGSRWTAVVYPQKNSNSKQQERHKWQGQNGTRVKMGCCRSLLERVELTVNSKKEWAKSQTELNSKKDTNGKVKMGQESRWAAVVHPLKGLK